MTIYFGYMYHTKGKRGMTKGKGQFQRLNTSLTSGRQTPTKDEESDETQPWSQNHEDL